jgi:putative resolvase
MKPREVLKTLNITRPTLGKYIKDGKIRYTKINDNYYDYNEDDVIKLSATLNSKPKFKRINITYSRVSLSKQKGDLESQINRMYNFSILNGISIDKQYSDIKSGMNFKDRKDFNKLLKEVTEFKVDKVIIENKDRLARFGFEMIEEFFKMFGTDIIVASNVDNKTYEQELTEDLISIIDYFSMKSYSNRRKFNKVKEMIKSDIN